MAAPSHPFAFLCGADDYLVGRAGKERFEALVREAGADDFSREIVNGFSANVGEVESCINRFRESVQTLPMFGGKRVIWLKDVSFLADSITGRAEGTLSQVEELQRLLTGLNPEEVGVLITASPIDRRRSFPKWCEQHADFALLGGDGEGASQALASVLQAEARALGTELEAGAGELLLSKVGPNTRLLVEEVRKLATYAGEGVPISEEHVAELTANVAEGEFFEVADAFSSGDLKWTLTALDRHFYSGGDARPVLAALQNRNRLLIQICAMVDSGDAKLGQRGLDGLQRASSIHGHRYGAAIASKSSFNIFTQNAWYLGKLAPGGKLPSLRRLIDNQRAFVSAFEELIRRPSEEEVVLRDLMVRCLGQTAA
jgi:DNA polymerase-3 subunit delta